LSMSLILCLVLHPQSISLYAHSLETKIAHNIAKWKWRITKLIT
jgi:hypothetical protein